MKKIAVCIKKYSIGKSSPVICMLDLLSDYYEVDLYVQNVWYTSATVLNKSTIHLIEIAGQDEKRSILGKLKRLVSFSFAKNINNNAQYSNYLCFDPPGFVFCKQLFPEAKPIYYSLELYFRNNHFNLEYPQEVMSKERTEINTIKGLIIQSPEREALFREEYRLSSQIPSLILPVTYMQSSVKEKSLLLRKKYNIRDKRIALHLGGIQEYHSCIELASAFSEIDDWVLVFHGYYFGNYIDKLRTTFEQRSIKNVFISDETYELIEDMDEVLKSADVGIAWYNNVSPNFTSAGKSSGKISAYLRFGLPVIANRYQSTYEAIEETGCGLCVDDFDEIKDALSKIDMNYDYYSDNCRKEFDKVYWFENYKATILKFLEN
jgi:glycosyltransferase involved in cell wall biosynthesis